MKTDYEYLTRRLLRANGEIHYEVDLVDPKNEMTCLTTFRAVPGGSLYRLVEERGEERHFYGLFSREDIDKVMKNLTGKFERQDFMSRLGLK